MNFASSVDFTQQPIGDRNNPLFIYLPGMDGTGELFQTQADKLLSCFDVRCLSIREDNSTSWQTLAKDTIRLIEIELTRKTNRQIYLCGESFGGCLALKVALSAPHLIDKLILVNPASSFNQFPLLGLGADITPWLPTWLHRYSAAGLLPFLAKLNRINDGDRLKLVESMKSLPPQVVSWRISLLREFKIAEEQLRSLKMSTLIVASESDALLPSVEEANKLVSLMPKAQKVFLPYSGHACLLETAVDLYDILAQENFIPPKSSFLLKTKKQ